MVILQVIVPVIVAVGGALAFLAYQHPRDYQKAGGVAHAPLRAP